ncbi:hypothetical protein EMCRGX_G003252 [Ephydatia muelleri]
MSRLRRSARERNVLPQLPHIVNLSNLASSSLSSLSDQLDQDKKFDFSEDSEGSPVKLVHFGETTVVLDNFAEGEEGV